jgi:hypothetical protein
MKKKHKIVPPSKENNKPAKDSPKLIREFEQAKKRISEEYGIDEKKLDKAFKKNKKSLISKFNQSSLIDERVRSLKGVSTLATLGGGGLLALSALLGGEVTFAFYGASYMILSMMGLAGVKKVKNEKKQLEQNMNEEIQDNIHKRLPYYKR